MKANDEALRQGLRAYAARIAAAHTAAPASLVWLRAERRRRRMAVERAERPLRIMQGIGLLCAAAAASWLLVVSGMQRSMTGTPMLVLSIAVPILAVCGCWAMAAASRRGPA